MSLNVPSLQQLGSSLPPEVQTALRAVLSAQDQFNRSISQEATPGLWQRPPYSNAWVDFSDSRYVRYRLEGVSVRIEGTMKSGVVGATAFTLPTGFRPIQRINIAVTSNGLFGNAFVDPDGSVQLSVGSNLSANLNFTFAVD